MGGGGGSWIADFARRHALIASAKKVYPDTRLVRRQRPEGVSYTCHVELPVDHYDDRRITIVFDAAAPSIPRVYADGPTASPHRYSKQELCLWYPGDGAERRWVPDDGLLHLLGMIQMHLFKEGYWRETGEWPGDEGPHEAGSSKGKNAEESAA